MNLFTSDSKSEYKIVATIFAIILVSELTLRPMESFLSKNIANIKTFPAISKQLHQSSGLRILFLGNSLTLEGVDLEVLRDELGSKDFVPFSAVKMVPDGTAIADWYYLFKRFYVDSKQIPDIVIIGFATDQLSDDYGLKIRALGRHFCRFKDTADLFRTDILKFDGRMEFLLSRSLAIFGNQPQIKHRILDEVIPYYRPGSRHINNIIRDSTMPNNGQDITKKQTRYLRLERLVLMLKRNNVKAAFVAMPIPYFWEVDPELVRIIEGNGMYFIDCRTVNGLTTDNFPDRWHLDKAGSAMYTRLLAQRLADYYGKKSDTDLMPTFSDSEQ